MNNNKKNILLIIGILLLLTGIIAITYAATTYTTGGNQNKISTGYITFTYNEQGNELKITNSNSISDDDGKILNDYFAFSVASKATGTVDIGYYIYLTPIEVEGEKLDNSMIKIYLSTVENEDDAILDEQTIMNPTTIANLPQFNNETFTYDATSQNHLIYSSVFNIVNNENTITHYYRLRMWLDENANPQYSTNDAGNSQTVTILDGEYKLKINVIGVNGAPKAIVKPE